jgi:hypothetical protein
VTTGLSATVANSILDALCRSVAWTDPAAFHVKLHLADPGSAGTTSPAANTTRQAVTFSAASGGAITNSAAVTWTSVSNTEVYTHVSFWDASSGGNFLGSDALNASASVTAGDTFQIPIGDLDLTLTVAA